MKTKWTKSLRLVSAWCLLVVGVGCTGSSDGETRDVVGDSASVGDSVVSQDDVQSSCLITARGIGPIQLGMTLDSARASFAGATFERSSDGEGVALVSVALGDSVLMLLHADERGREAAIDWSRPITFMETFSSLCQTSNGVYPGQLVSEVEGTLGSTLRITMSEIESRQFIEFERQSEGLIFRLDYTGEFAPGSRETKRYAAGAKLLSVALARR